MLLVFQCQKRPTPEKNANSTEFDNEITNWVMIPLRITSGWTLYKSKNANDVFLEISVILWFGWKISLNPPKFFREQGSNSKLKEYNSH